MRYFIVPFVVTLIALAAGPVASATAQTPIVARDDAGLIASWYQHYLGRNPDQQGLQGWVQEMSRGRNVEAAIVGSDEYFIRHGSTEPGFVTGLYVDVLSRQPSSDEVQGWLVRLQQVGYNRETLAGDFLTAAQAELAMRGVLPSPNVIPPPATVVVPQNRVFRPFMLHSLRRHVGWWWWR